VKVFRFYKPGGPILMNRLPGFFLSRVFVGFAPHMRAFKYRAFFSILTTSFVTLLSRDPSRAFFLRREL